jgi:uracil phosphoribosyltransferase
LLPEINVVAKPNLFVSRHPLVLDRLGRLRARETPSPEFRRLVWEMAQLLFFEAARDLQLAAGNVMTPLAECPAVSLAESVGLVPILRAGLGMSEAILTLMPTAQVWHLGLYRDHKTLKPVTYYNKLAGQPALDRCFVLDPMLATGGSAIAAIDLLKAWGLRRLQFLGLIAAPQGVEALHRAHPDVDVYLAAIDTHLDALSYIVPGLGDAGDRQFGTFGE